MMYKTLYRDLIKILTHVVDNNIYGSVEIFFEKGRVTQITQRIIKKVQQPDSANKNYGSPTID
ncbi:hypothetical protein HYS94_05050 [Candidatus Daviesbacteria bacterium]|nr:hypothetical protein [Candidatus Daviesbacteria bacterium]